MDIKSINDLIQILTQSSVSFEKNSVLENQSLLEGFEAIQNFFSCDFCRKLEKGGFIDLKAEIIKTKIYPITDGKHLLLFQRRSVLGVHLTRLACLRSPQSTCPVCWSIPRSPPCMSILHPPCWTLV